MALARCLFPLSPETTDPLFPTTSTSLTPSLSLLSSSRPLKLKPRNFSFSPKLLRASFQVKSTPEESEASPLVDMFTEFKQLLLPVVDRNPYLTEGTKQVLGCLHLLRTLYFRLILPALVGTARPSELQSATTTAALAKKYGAEITVVVIDEKEKETLSEHDTQLASIRWHLSEGGFKEFKLLERLGEGNKPTAIIGEVADEMNMDLVVMSMEAIHSKHVDANLLAEFSPCPVLLLPL